ncbi:MAG: lantibiotic dehydratase, partial [Streptosporangiaceae bacterium]
MTQGEAIESHRVPLEGTTWSVWRDVCLRSAGFPADMVLAICDEPLARSADLIGADLAGADPAGRVAYDTAFADAAGRLSRAVAAVDAHPRFREAVTWQNPGLAQRLRDAGVGTSRRSQDRKRELLIANYLQRYCLKNDTIGFFGPVGWASAGSGAVGLVVVPGEQ